MSRGTTATRILVVDDNPLICDSVRRVLELDGHAVETALSGKAALDLFNKSKFDLTIADYEMPEMNGKELIAAIKALDSNQPIILITAYAEMLTSAGDRLAGLDSMLSKPFDVQELRQTIARLIARP